MRIGYIKVYTRALFKENKEDGHASAFSRRDAPEVCRKCPPKNKGAGKAGCRLHPWVPCNKKHGGRTTGSTGITPAFPAQWFTAYFALSPVTGLSCHCRQRNRFHQLDASVGASGPHDFAVRLSAIRLARYSPAWHCCVHRIPHPTSVTTAKRPSYRGGMARINKGVSTRRRSEIFLRTGLDTGRETNLHGVPIGQISRGREHVRSIPRATTFQEQGGAVSDPPLDM